MQRSKSVTPRFRTAACQIRVRLDHQLALVELVEHDGRLDAGDLAPAAPLAAPAQRDDRLRGQAGVVVEQDDLGQPLQRDALAVQPKLVAARLAQGDAHEAGARPERALGPDDGDGLGDLSGAQRIERVRGAGGALRDGHHGGSCSCVLTGRRSAAAPSRGVPSHASAVCVRDASRIAARGSGASLRHGLATGSRTASAARSGPLERQERALHKCPAQPGQPAAAGERRDAEGYGLSHAPNAWISSCWTGQAYR